VGGWLRGTRDASGKLEFFAELELPPGLELDPPVRSRGVAVGTGPLGRVEMNAVLAAEAEREPLGLAAQAIVDARLHWKG
jgi:hypothetical protein